MAKILIAYYSRKGQNYVSGSIRDLEIGNTEVAAEYLKELTGGDLHEISTVKNYPTGYEETTKVAGEELRANVRPELLKPLQDIDDYDTIFLGYPNWWGTMPMAVFTFLESYNLSGKTILPFCTHEGSGLGRSEKDIMKQCPNTKVLKGLAIHGTTVAHSIKDIEKWLQETIK